MPQACTGPCKVCCQRLHQEPAGRHVYNLAGHHSVRQIKQYEGGFNTGMCGEKESFSQINLIEQ